MNEGEIYKILCPKDGAIDAEKVKLKGDSIALVNCLKDNKKF